MVEVIGIALLVALVGLLAYGMSATEAMDQDLSIPRAKTPSESKRAA
jgi:hypothetical protein